MVLSSKDKGIASPSGNAQGSPFVIAIKRANIKVLPHIINAVVLSSAFSAANLSLMQGSRILFALASKGQAPQIFLRTNKRRIPYVGLAFTAAFLPLSYMSASSTSSTVFLWFQDITSSNLLVGWITISLNHIALSRAMKAQGYTRKDLPYTFKFTPLAAWVSLFFSSLILLTCGFPNFLKDNFEASSFVSSYIVIPIAVILTAAWKLFKKTKFLRPEEVNLEIFFRDIENNPEPPLPPYGLKDWFIAIWL